MESLAPGARISEVARRHDLNRGLLQAWRRQALSAKPVDESAAAFVPICCSDEVASPLAALGAPKDASAPPGVIEIELGRV